MMSFTKAHGLGNDFILIDTTPLTDTQINAIIQHTPALCARHIGIGADGVILALPSTIADIKMRVINSDGSEPEMCGNGIRCFAKWVYLSGQVLNPSMSIETGRGILYPELIIENDKIKTIKVDMGEPILDGHPLTISTPKITVDITPISMGNPHGIIWQTDLSKIDLDLVGPGLSTHATFPNQANIEFAQILSKNEVNVIVWERGAGKTMACGTGACAVAVAGILQNKLNRTVKVNLPGGPLDIHWDEDSNHVWMTGPAELVYEGKLAL
jgi:diaminopimelate epimerase